jgi:hypothetical protein
MQAAVRLFCNSVELSWARSWHNIMRLCPWRRTCQERVFMWACWDRTYCSLWTSSAHAVSRQTDPYGTGKRWGPEACSTTELSEHSPFSPCLSITEPQESVVIHKENECITVQPLPPRPSSRRVNSRECWPRTYRRIHISDGSGV